MKKLWIIGNSGAARECYWLFQDMLKGPHALCADMEFAGFLSWRGHQGDLKSLASFFKGEALDMIPASGDLFAIGIGQPDLRWDVYSCMKDRGACFFTLRHPVSDINPKATVGNANIFQLGSTVFCDAVLGHANYLNGSVNLSHDAKVGDANFFGPFAIVLGGARVGSRNLVSVRSTLLPGARIGDDNIIAPGSVIYKGCASGRRMAGNPATILGNA